MNHRVFVDLSGLGAELVLAEKLFALGARTSIVCHLCGIGKKTALRLYKTIHQKSPKQGLLPWDENWISQSPVNNLHASMFVGMILNYLPAETPDIGNVKHFINAYELYSVMAAQNPKPCKREIALDQFRVLDINRAWQIILQFKGGDSSLVLCSKCHAQYLTVTSKREVFRKCPCCEVWTDRLGRRRWLGESLIMKSI